jgi:hypothetical protein
MDAMIAAQAGRRALAGTVLAVFAVTVVLIAYGLTGRSVLDQDVFVMAEIAQRVLAGDRLYDTIWDNKPPLTILVYALPQLIAPYSYTAIQVGLGLWSCLQAFVWWRFAPGPPLLRLGGALVTAAFPLSNFYFAWFSSEDTANLFVLVVLVCAYRVFDSRRCGTWGPLWMGAGLVLAFHARQTALPFGAVVVVAVWMAPERRVDRIRALIRAALGALVAWAVIVGLVAAIGDLPGYVEAVFVGPRRYVSEPRRLIELVSAFRSDVSTLVLFVSAAYLLTRRRDRWFALAVAGSTAAAVLLPMRAHLHYWEQVGPGMVLLLHMAARGLLEHDRRWEIAASVLLPAFLLANGAWTVAKCCLRPDVAPLYDAAGEIDRAARDGDRLFVAGGIAGPIYFATRAPPANTFFWEYFLYGIPDLLPRPIEAVLREYRERPPEVMAVTQVMLARANANASNQDDAAVRLVRSLLNERAYLRLDAPSSARVGLVLFRLAPTIGRMH